jgi:DNA modification methylase
VRTDLTSSEAIAYAIADNRTAELAEWDDDVLAAQLNGLLAEDEELLTSAGFTDEELEELLGDIDGVDPAEITEDEVPEPPADPITKPGDLWILGQHRLLCGDSTKAEDVERLMDGKRAGMVHTDPPYGMSYQSNMRTKTAKFAVIENDDKILTEWIPRAIDNSDGWVFIWTTWKVLEQWFPVVKPFGKITNMVVWSKGGGGIGDLKKTFSTDHEIAFVFNRGAELCGKRIGSVWSFGKDAAGEYEHPTQKPVALAAEAIDKTTRGGCLVYDPFLGSGTTLIAAEQLGRTCYGMEISPQYCDVIVKRWETLTGQKATLQAADQSALPEATP